MAHTYSKYPSIPGSRTPGYRKMMHRQAYKSWVRSDRAFLVDDQDELVSRRRIDILRITTFVMWNLETKEHETKKETGK